MNHREFSHDELKHQLAELPRQAVVAFAVRCARRSEDGYFRSLSKGLRVAEQYADGLLAPYQAVLGLEQDFVFMLDHEDDAADEDYAVAYALIVASTACAVELTDRKPTPSESETMLRFAANAAYCSASRSSSANSRDTILSPRAVSAAQRDLAFLRTAYGSEKCAENSSVLQEAFGSLWPVDELTAEERATHQNFEGNVEHLRDVMQLTRATGDEREELIEKIDGISPLRLFGANLESADLRNVKFQAADLDKCDLRRANLSGADLTGCSIRKASLGGADLSEAQLHHSDLRWSHLYKTVCLRTSLKLADLAGAELNDTLLVDVDLAATRGLAACLHRGRCTIDLRTLARSGALPVKFLRGCGLNDWEIQAAKLYDPALRSDQRSEILNEIHRLQEDRPMQFYSLFISYAHVDEAFAKKLYENLQSTGVRCWYAPEHIKSGQKIHEQVDRAIQAQDRLLLVLSDASMKSNWVKTEIASARAKERAQGRQVLFPVRLVTFEAICDWKCFDADQGIDSAREVREYFIPDFTNWADSDSFGPAFERLLKDLRANDVPTSK